MAALAQDGSLFAKASFLAAWPLTVVLSLTMSQKPSLYIPTILMAVVWLAVLAFGLDWAASRVGCSLGLDDQLIGARQISSACRNENLSQSPPPHPIVTSPSSP